MNTRKLFSMMLCATLSLSMIATAYADDLECSINFGETDVSTSENRTDSGSFSDWVFEGEAEQTEENTQRSLRTAAETREKKIITSCEQSEIVDYGSCGDLVRWQLDKDGLLVISGEGEMKDYFSYMHGTLNPWRDNATATKKVVVLEGVETIGAAAFYGCGDLERVELSDSVRSIGKNAFSYCSALEDIEFSDDLDYIGEYAFSECKGLSTVKIPDAVTIINESTFRYSGISDLELGSGLTEIAKSAFFGCVNLTTIVLPDTMETIGDDAFYNTGLEKIELSDSISYIGKGVFSSCGSLSDVKLPNKITVISEGLFEGCVNLESIELPDTVTEIGKSAFKHTGIRSIVLPNSVEIIRGEPFWKEGAFAFCPLESIYIPKSVTTIEISAFEGCDKLKDVYYSGSLSEWKDISIGDYNESLTGAYIHYNDTSFGGNTDGDSTSGGNTTGGSTDSGNTPGGNTSGGNTDSGNTTGGNTSGGNTSGGNTDSGNTTGGSTDSGNTSGGSTDSGNTSGGNTDSGNTSGGNTTGGNTDSGNTTGGNTSGGNTTGGNTDGGNTTGGNTDGGNTSGGNTSGGNTNTECTHEYNEGVITKAPDCTNGGEKRYTCKKCGSSKVELLSALGHAYSEGHCIRCNALDVNFVPTISGPSLVFHGKTAKFTSTAAYTDFVKVLVDGIQISSNSYTLSQGSTIVTLTGNYTQSLSFGDHTITIVSSTGSPQMRFNVPNSPATGDNSAIGLYVIGISLSVIGIAVCAEILRRKIKTSN